ncbi:MAG: hypothetical protein H7196_05085 [candidate division SR1 bacterium]|nr:hypothetical protein [candidate division SR1 bacterium]
MISLTNIVSYIFLFVALCIFVFLLLALINIFSKSYQPTLIVPIIIVVIFLFIFNTVTGYGAIRRMFQNISNNIDGTTQPTSPNPTRAKNIF